MKLGKVSFPYPASPLERLKVGLKFIASGKLLPEPNDPVDSEKLNLGKELPAKVLFESNWSGKGIDWVNWVGKVTSASGSGSTCVDLNEEEYNAGDGAPEAAGETLDLTPTGSKGLAVFSVIK